MPGFALLPPLKGLRGRFDHRAKSDRVGLAVLEVVQAKSERIDSGGVREFVHVRLAGEVVGRRRKGAVRALPQRGRNLVKRGILIGDVVG